MLGLILLLLGDMFHFSFLKMFSCNPCPLGVRTAGVLKSPPFQTGEYATDEEEDEAGPAVPGGDMAIEVFELPENEDMFSPSDLDTSKLSHKFKEVSHTSAKRLAAPARCISKHMLFLFE